MRKYRKRSRRTQNIHPPTIPDLHNSPTAKDQKINSAAVTKRLGNGAFAVCNILRAGGTRWHMFSFGCMHCLKELIVLANGPANVPRFAKEEIHRLALLEHLRTEHGSKAKPSIKPPEMSAETDEEWARLKAVLESGLKESQPTKLI